MKINYMLDDKAFEPIKAHTADAGFDIRTPYGFTLLPGKTEQIKTGVHFEIPNGYVGMLKSKSGLNVVDGITCEGVIDSGYTGGIVAKLRMDECCDMPRVFERGDKIVQIVFIPIPEVELVKVSKFAETERGANGFGSTGR